MCGVGLGFWTTNGRDTLIGGFGAFSSNVYWKICFKFCTLEQIIATVLFICISSTNNKRSLLRFQSTTAPTNRGWSACAVLNDVPSAPRFLVDVFSFVVHAEFEVGVLAPEEFRWKIFLGEDLESLVVLVCHLHGKLFVIHRWVNFVSQTMNKHFGHRRAANSMLPGNAKCSMTSLAATKHIFRERFIYCALNLASSETQGQIVGTRESLNGRKDAAWRKVKNGFPFLRATFFRPFRLSLASFICPWVSEDANLAAG